jgi:hypothetical protein
MKKVYDMAVKTGEYTNAQGETKGRYQNVGAVMKGDNGLMIIMDRTFNPAGLPNPENRSNIIISLFEPRDNNQQQRKPEYPEQPQAQTNNPESPAGGDPFNDDIPFSPWMNGAENLI